MALSLFLFFSFFFLLLLDNKDILVEAPLGWRSLLPARGSCAPTPFAAHRLSQKPPIDHRGGDVNIDGVDVNTCQH